jgi:hypothetical protein
LIPKQRKDDLAAAGLRSANLSSKKATKGRDPFLRIEQSGYWQPTATLEHDVPLTMRNDVVT